MVGRGRGGVASETVRPSSARWGGPLICLSVCLSATAAAREPPPGERIISVMIRSRAQCPPRECPRLLLSQPRPPLHESRSRHGRASRGDSRRRALWACSMLCCSRPCKRACMVACGRIGVVRGGIHAYSASCARACAYLGTVVAWCGARSLEPQNARNTPLSMCAVHRA